MIHEDFEKAVAYLVKYHGSHYPNGAEKANVSLSIQSNEASRQFYLSACNDTVEKLTGLGGVPLRPLSHERPTAIAYKAENARLSLELTLWKDFKFVQQQLKDDELHRSLDKALLKSEKWVEEDLVDKVAQFFDLKAYEVYHFWVLETVMQMAEEAREALGEVIANGSLDDAEAKQYGKTAGEWMGLFDLYHVIADATRNTISQIEQVSLKLSSDLATRAGSKERFGDVKTVFLKFAAHVAWATDAFAGVPRAAKKTSIGGSTFVRRLGALDCQISYLMNWAVSWDIASQVLKRGLLLTYTPAKMQETMLGFLKERAVRFEAHSRVWQEIVAHIEGKMLDLVWQESAGDAVPATFYEELERAKKAAIGNLSASWEMERQVRMTKVRFNEVNRGMEEPTHQWAPVEAGSSQSGNFFPEARIFRPAMDKVAKMPAAAASTGRPANEEGKAAQRQATPDVDDLPDYEDFEDEDAAASTERPAATKDGKSAARQATPDEDDLPDYEDFEEDAPSPPSDKAEHPGTAAKKPEEDDTRSPRYSPTPSPPPSPPPASPSRATDQPGSSSTNARDSPPPPSPSNKRKRSASPPDEEEENDSRSPRQSPTPPPPPPKRARSASPAHSPSPPPSTRAIPPPAPPSPSHTQAAADVGEPPAASSSNKRKRSASPPEEEEDEGEAENDTRSPHHSPTPPPPSRTQAAADVGEPPAASPSPPPSPRLTPPPAPPSPSHTRAAADVGEPPAASTSNKRKRSASPREEEEEAVEDDNRSPDHSPTPPPPPAKRARSTSPARSPPPPNVDTNAEEEDDDEPEGSNTTKKTRRGRKSAARSKKGKGKAATTAGATKTGRVTKPKPKTPYKKRDYRAEAEANGGVRRSKRIQEMKKG